MSQSHLGDRGKHFGGKKWGENWVEAGTERGRGNMISHCEGWGRTEALRTSRKNGNRQPQEVGYGGPSHMFQRPRRWETPRTQRERPWIKCCPASSGVMELQLFLFEGSPGTKLEKHMRERRSMDKPKLGSISRGGKEQWHCYSYCVVLVDRRLAWLPSKRSNKQLSQMQILALSQWMEANDPYGWFGGKPEGAEEEGGPIHIPAVSTERDPRPQDLSEKGPTTRQHTAADMKTMTNKQWMTTWSDLSERRCT